MNLVYPRYSRGSVRVVCQKVLRTIELSFKLITTVLSNYELPLADSQRQLIIT